MRDAEVRGGQAASGRVLDRDLQDAVNGLWAAGAEAVSVNGLRLNALTAIRSAGEAVLVDFRPLSPPYVLRAVGDAAGLERAFQTGEAGRRLATYPGLYGIAVGVRRARALELPAARLPDLQVGADPVIPALALVLGVVLGLVLEPTVPAALQPYLPIAVVAALDAVFGAVRAQLDGIFDDRVFVVSFVSNVLVAALVVFLGDQLGVGGQLSTGVVVVLGIRIFSNAAAIRRHVFRA